jgi:hypothetical protein
MRIPKILRFATAESNEHKWDKVHVTLSHRFFRFALNDSIDFRMS